MCTLKITDDPAAYDEETRRQVHKTIKKVSGDIVAQSAVEISDDDDALTLYRKIVPLGAALIERAAF